MIRLRLGLFVGLIVGYYFGAMAGRERYEQLNRLLGKVKRADATHIAADKAKSAAEAGLHKATDEAKHRLHRNGRTETATFSPS